jgi:queuine/archaeosine tRNA-ribosyltransferase
MSAQVLLEAHNTTHYLRFFEAVRQSIKDGKIQAYRDALLAWKQRWIVMRGGKWTG